MTTNAERLVSGAVVDALTRTVLIDDQQGINHAVLLTAIPSNDGRTIAVRVKPFDGDEVAEVQVLVSPARIVDPEPAVNGSGPVDPVIATPDGSTG
jgi:hypothetical protein